MNLIKGLLFCVLITLIYIAYQLTMIRDFID
jgi:hypothetical protein